MSTQSTPLSLFPLYPLSPPSHDLCKAFEQILATTDDAHLWDLTQRMRALGASPDESTPHTPPPESVREAIVSLGHLALSRLDRPAPPVCFALAGYLCDWVVEKTDATEEHHQRALDQIEHTVIRTLLDDTVSPRTLLSSLMPKRSARMDAMWRSLLEQISPNHPHYQTFLSMLSWSFEDHGAELFERHLYAISAKHYQAEPLYRGLSHLRPQEASLHASHLFHHPECPESLRLTLIEDACQHGWPDFLMPQIEQAEAWMHVVAEEKRSRWPPSLWNRLRILGRFWRAHGESLQTNEPTLFSQATQRIEAFCVTYRSNAAPPIEKNISFGAADWVQSIEGFDIWLHFYLPRIQELLASEIDTIWQRAVSAASWLASPSSLQQIIQTWDRHKEERQRFVIDLLPRWREPACVLWLLDLLQQPLQKITKQRIVWALIHLSKTPNCWPERNKLLCAMQPYLGKEANVWEAALALLAETNEAPQKDHVAEILHHYPLDPTKAWVCFALWFVRPQSGEASWFVALLFHKDASIQRQAVEIFSSHPRHAWLLVLEQWIVWARHHSEKKALQDRTISSVVPIDAQHSEDLQHAPPTLIPPTSFDFSVATIRRVARILRRMRVQCSLLDVPLQRAQDEMDQALFSD